MQISSINSTNNSSFKGYAITEPGLKTIKKLQNPEEKRAIIDCCRIFENTKYVHFKIDSENKEPIFSLKIPEVPFWMERFGTMDSGHFTNDGVLIHAKGEGKEKYWIPVDLSAADWVKMHKYANELQEWRTSPYIIEKLNRIMDFGQRVENAHINRESNGDLNKSLNKLYKTSNTDLS